MNNKKNVLILIIVSIFLIGYVAIFGLGDKIKGANQMRFGIDIRGGVEAVFEPENINRKATEDELNSARNIIETRLDSKNITDREVTVDKDSRYIIVRFPWKSDEKNFNPEDAINELGEMAKLTFRDEEGNVLIEGKNVKISSPQQSSNNLTGYEVKLVFDSEGAKLFEQTTQKLIGKPLGIYMDETRISNPTVQSKISGGTAVINGLSSMEEAKDLSEKINAGSLPFSLKTTSFSTISPSLGNNALNVMIYSGIIAFVVVCLFMIIYYKLPGIVAALTLVLQSSLQLLAISIPQFTLTLPGIAGIILSIGMTVDANVIIAERISEEIKNGRSIKRAIVYGYKNAFSSVLDGNITTAIVAIILMLFGSGSMYSFGYTLLVGMIINVVIGVFVSKHLILSLVEYNKFEDAKYFKKKKDVKVKKFYENRFIFVIISSILAIIGIIGCFVNGVKLDTQFVGGAVLTYSIEGEINTDKIKEVIEKDTDRTVTVQATSDEKTKKNKISLTFSGNQGMTPEKQKEITKKINESSDNINAILSETYVVEPYIGAKALKNAGLALGLSVFFIIIYVWIRFNVLSGLSAGITAMVALLHDVAIVFFSFVLFNIPLNDAFVAVVLTIIGYSINDTIVVYDRIRENRNEDDSRSLVALVNNSITQTLARSINTSLTTGVCVLIILIAAIIFNIKSITQFSLPMLFGLISGCYSSVCIASILWARFTKKL